MRTKYPSSSPDEGNHANEQKKKENMKSWTEIKTDLKMKTIESAYAAACREHGQSPRGTVNEVRLYLGQTFGQIRTKAALVAAIEATF